MKKILVLTEDQFNAAKNLIDDATRCVANDYGDMLDRYDDDKIVNYSGSEYVAEHKALDSIDLSAVITMQDDKIAEFLQIIKELV